MYRVSDILNPEFARSWHEAVAIVQEIVSQLAPGATIPEPEDLLIDDNGNLQLGFGPDEAAEPGLGPRQAPQGTAERGGRSGRPARSRGREREVQSGAFVGVGFPACPGVLRAAGQGERASGHRGASAGLRSDARGAAGGSASRVRPASREGGRQGRSRRTEPKPGSRQGASAVERLPLPPPSSSQFWERSSSTRARTISTRRVS